MTEHKTCVQRNSHGNRFWWECSCGDKQKKRAFYAGHAEQAGVQHAKDKGDR